MKTFIGFLVVAGYILLCHPEWIGPLLIAGAWVLAFLIFWAFFCYGFSMLRLFFKF